MALRGFKRWILLGTVAFLALVLAAAWFYREDILRTALDPRQHAIGVVMVDGRVPVAAAVVGRRVNEEDVSWRIEGRRAVRVRR